MKAAFIIIATGQSYIQYASELIDSIHLHTGFESQIFVFTDNPQPLQTKARTFFTEALGYPKQTLMRYHLIRSKEHIFEAYDQLFYIDADMKFVDEVELADIASEGLTAVLHPGYARENTSGTPETNPKSQAFLEGNHQYYAGGFQGGNRETFLTAAHIMAERIDADLANDIVAVWHDESHWNKLLDQHTPKTVLSPSYCYNEDYDGRYGWTPEEYPAKIMCLDKLKRGWHPQFNNAR